MLSLAFLPFPVRGTGRAIWLSLVFSALLYYIYALLSIPNSQE